MPLFWLSSAFLAGLVLGASLLWNGTAWAGIAGIFVLAALIERRYLSRTAWYPKWMRLARLPVSLVLAALALGGLRFITSQPVVTEADLAWYNHTVSYHLTGVIQEPSERSEKTDTLVVAVDQISLAINGESRQVRGLALVRLAVGQAWRYGDRIELEGAPIAPQKGQILSYSDALARHSIYTELNYPRARLAARNAGSPFWAFIYDLREQCLQTVNRLLPQPESALLAGILLGSVRDLPPAVVKAFQDTGTAHIIAVSGFNIAIISGLFIQVLGRIMRARYAVPLTILAIGGYALLTGAAPSVVRAAIMGGMGLIGPLLGRRQAGLNTLVFTAGVMCLLSPGLPWDISFQLSFAATLGLVLFADPLQRGFSRLAGRWISAPLARRLAGPVGTYFLFTLAAQIFTLPVTAVHFERVSLSAVLANPLILPAQPLAMILGSLALVLGLIFFPLGQIVAGLVWPFLAFTIRVAEWLAMLPFGAFNLGQISLGFIAVYYALLIGLALPSLRRVLGRVWKPALSIGLAGLLAAGLWRTALAAPDGRLHLDLFNLPDGPAVLLRAPDGQAWLLNGSSQTGALADALGRRLPLFEDHLDGLLLTARSAAPLQGLEPLLEHYSPRRLAVSSRLPETATSRRLIARVEDQGGKVVTLDPGARIDLGSGVVLRVLADTSGGTALWIEWGRFGCLLPGGIPLSGLEAALRADRPGVSLLILNETDLVAQDGQTWQASLHPSSAIASPGDQPLPPGWIGLEPGIRAISLITDGKQLWIERQTR